MAHRVRPAVVCLDLPAATHDAGLAFWAATFGATPREDTAHGPFHALGNHGALGWMVQRIDDPTPRAHIDLESDDVRAEIARLVAIGATMRDDHGDWAVLEDPTGQAFCVVPAWTPDFFDHARQVTGPGDVP